MSEGTSGRSESEPLARQDASLGFGLGRLRRRLAVVVSVPPAASTALAAEAVAE